MIPENERIEFEGQTYVNPETSLQEQNSFIENLRSSQAARNAEIGQETAQLGSYPVPQSNLGGLGGGGSYFEARNSTPQGVALANNLRAAAQAQALNDILSNEQAMMKQRYSNAQRAARQRARARYSGGGGSGSGGGTTGGDTGNVSGWSGEVETEESPTREFYGVPGADVSETDTHYVYTDQNTGEKVYVSKDYMNKIYDENGNITDDGAVILDTRRLLGL